MKTSKFNITWNDIFQRLAPIDVEENIVYGVPKGGMIASAFLKYAKVTHTLENATIILDDIIDSGKTKQLYKTNIPFFALFDKLGRDACLKDKWLVFPWEVDHPNGEDTVQQNIIRLLQFIGEDVTREGLVQTPNRIIRSFDELYSGYKKDPADIMTVFKGESYDEIVLLKNIEMYSMCEHHMLPFFGKAHVAYIPNDKLIGISKLARLVDIYAKRLQIQERIGQQVTNALMDHLQPKGAACIIEAKHTCMCMRGVGKQNSTMVTSSMIGAFLEKPAARQELMQLIKE